MGSSQTNCCWICGLDVQKGTQAPDISPYRAVDARRIVCVRCGTYDIPASLFLMSCLDEYAGLLPFLSAHVRQANEFEKRIPRIDARWPELAELHRRTSIPQRAEKFLRAIAIRTEDPGSFVDVEPSTDFPLVDALNGRAVEYFVEYWANAGCMYVEPHTSIDKTAIAVRLTVEGWNALDPTASGGIPGRVFVAMSFNSDLDEAYEHGMRMAIEHDCRMKAVRIDREHFNEQISDRILAEIRRSAILVADFTGHKAGVYFEAGFALALGRTVIWTCREDCIGSAHFDTRQYPHILWNTAAELRLRLADRIQALVGSGPLLIRDK